MNRSLVRWLVVIPTSLATACGGRACGTSLQSSSQTSSAIAAAGGAIPPNVSTPEDLNAVLQGVETLATGIPRETFDVKAVMRVAGNDPAAILNWVRDNTTWVPYRGALRGPTGVLMDRLGNSLDRSLLVAELLRQSGRTVRLAHAALSESRARDLLTVISTARPPVPSPQRAASPAQAEQDLAQIARAFQLDAQGFRKATDEAATRRNQLLTELGKRLEVQLDMLVDTATGFAKATDEGPRVVAAAADHWWVQCLDGARWIDLDSAVPKDRVSTPLDADRTFSFDKPTGQIPLAAEYAQEVTIRIVVEQLAAGRLTRKIALEHDFRPAEIFGESIVLQHVPLAWPANTTFLQAQSPAGALRDAALNQKEWLPIVTIGSRTIRQSSFVETGELNANPGKTGGTGTAIGSAFSGGFDALGGADEPAAGGQLTAEWIEYEIRVPGEPRRLVTRDVFDLLESRPDSGTVSNEPSFTAADRLRRALSLLGRVDILPFVARLSGPYVQARRFENLLRNREAISSVLAKMAAGDLAGALDPAARLRPDADPLLTLALARFDWSWIASDVYVDAPNIFTYHREPIDDGSGGLAVREGIDIVANGVGVRPTSRLLPFYARLLQGITDINAEAIVMGGTPVGNAGVLHGSSTARDQWVVVRGTADAASSGLRWSNEFNRRVNQSLGAGYVVIAPRQADAPAQSAFWAINPSTGDTIGIGYLGWGQATVEYVMVGGLVGVAAFLLVCAVVTARAERLRQNAPSLLTCLGVFAAGPGVWADQFADTVRPARLPPPSVSQPPYSRMCGARMLCR